MSFNVAVSSYTTNSAKLLVGLPSLLQLVINNNDIGAIATNKLVLNNFFIFFTNFSSFISNINKKLKMFLGL
ncbi:hypothetical protein [Malacoplasma muris]|uniref:hypothetical protein n=1 Tax=Malacoplasma muris TaxID=2119 RepID=UPI00398F3513